MANERLTHVDEAGAAHMVDVSAKAETTRQAVARGRITMSAEAARAIMEGSAKKGDVLAVARVAGIMAAMAAMPTATAGRSRRRRPEIAWRRSHNLRRS